MRAGQRGARRGITALALSAGLVTTGTITGTTAVAHAGEQSSGQGDRSVTLITGDRVELAGDRVVRVVPGPGRGRLPVRTFTRDGHQHVVPADAIALVDSGKLDPRLFDVTSLAEFGYDDSRRTTVPVIVRPAAGARSGVTALAAKGSVSGLVTGTVEKSGSAWESLRGGAVEKVWLDGVRKVSLDRSTKQIGAPAAWQAGVTGKGVKVAVLDTGVDEKHPDLQGRQIAEKNFTDSPDNTDEVGHGTHVASTIASKGEQYRGVAPDAEILDGKVCQPGGCSESAILGGMQWAAEQGANVINMSLGGGDTPEIDPLEEAVNRISQETGALFVIAAGNSGSPETIGSPGSAESALTVGAVDRNDGIAPFSSRGPAADGAVKPDVTAPGVDIVAAEAGTQGHVSMSGTSMATPHVAGVVALLKQQHPDWTGARLKATIMASAKANPSLTAFDQGTGRVDVPKMLAQQVIAEPANINFGVQQWPHDDDQKVVREVTYRNPGKEPVTLDLSVDVKGPDGKPSPAGLFTVSPAKITIPGGGEAKATITADTKANAPDGAYSGAIVASNGLRTLVSVNREVESYDTAVSVLGSDGNPAESHSTVFINTKTGKAYPGLARNVRLPKGEYLVDSGIITPDFKVAFQVQPKFQVTGKGSITIDARNAKPVALKTPDAGAKGMIGTIGYSTQVAGRTFGHGWAFFDGLAGQVSTAQIGPAAPGFSTTIAEQFQGTPRDEKTPVSYRLMYTENGMPTGYERTAKAHELAEMTTSFRYAGEGRQHGIAVMPNPVDGSGGFGWFTQVPEGGRAIDLVSTVTGTWSWIYDRVGPDNNNEYSTETPNRSFKGGKKYSQTFGAAIIGPSVPSAPGFGLARLEDQIAVRVPLSTDSNGGAGRFSGGTAKTSLFHNGTKLGEQDRPTAIFDVPAAEGTYRAEMEHSRDAELSNKVSGAWTFKAKHTTDITHLPLTVVRFLPKLDDKDTAHGRVLLVPLKVEQAQNTPKVKRVTVEVSYDDGATWKQVQVAGDKAIVHHPKNAKFASLRAKTTDAAGNTGEVTIIHAYKIAS
ncbi:S8 family serine peptidase [Lentzea sp. BCCO 10_0061]|uniref:S8 family serine peptidase n=1 Tax=Lentzea sokolovensis TaxID=3095429 RepID=A0ABU4V1J0_9PSEU|nr:S8 family serine peptidase [Lentzea sp. BCCO 10_0061]MDX8145217.1 S8 family serine peptidase [Lentzea sp. BCCO 10_0061]